MQKHESHNHDFAWLHAVATHVGVTVLAVGIAFSMPFAAQFILYQWWPGVMTDANLLLATEIGLAALLLLFFNAAGNSIQHRATVGSARLAALVHARIGSDRLSRWRERRLFRKLPAARDAYVLGVTGGDVFGDDDSRFRPALQSACEVRVLLANPAGLDAWAGGDKLQDGAFDPVQLRADIRRSVDYLKSLRQLGRKVTLKFYDQPPFWKLVILGEHVWVQYCQGGDEEDRFPEFVFALNHRDPRHGLFMPFYMHFLEMWGQRSCPELDFERDELVYRDGGGNEVNRVPLQQVLSRRPGAEASKKRSGVILAEAVGHQRQLGIVEDGILARGL